MKYFLLENTSRPVGPVSLIWRPVQSLLQFVPYQLPCMPWSTGPTYFTTGHTGWKIRGKLASLLIHQRPPITLEFSSTNCVDFRNNIVDRTLLCSDRCNPTMSPPKSNKPTKRAKKQRQNKHLLDKPTKNATVQPGDTAIITKAAAKERATAVAKSSTHKTHLQHKKPATQTRNYSQKIHNYGAPASHKDAFPEVAAITDVATSPGPVEVVAKQSYQARNEDKLVLAMEYKLNARNTNYEERDNAFWLLKAGFAEEDITRRLRQRFKKAFSYRFKKIIRPITVPKEEQPWNKHWIRKTAITPDLSNFLLEAHSIFQTSKKDNTSQYFTRIGRTNIKQHILHWLGSGKLKSCTQINKIYEKCNALFQSFRDTKGSRG